MRLSAKIGAWLALLLALVLVAMGLMFRAGSQYSPDPNVPSATKRPAAPPSMQGEPSTKP